MIMVRLPVVTIVCITRCTDWNIPARTPAGPLSLSLLRSFRAKGRHGVLRVLRTP